MKRIIFLIVTIFMLTFCLTGCGNGKSTSLNTESQNNISQDQNVEVKIRGVLSFAGASETELDEKGKSIHTKKKNNVEHFYFDDLVTMLSAFETGSINRIMIPYLTANYLVSRNNKYTIDYSSSGIVPFCMLLKSGNEVLRDRINEAENILKETNQDIELIDNMENEVAVEFEKFEGADTITFAITGDLPPMDYVGADGEPKGFNVRYIKALCKEMKVNAKIIQINSGARAMALATGKADVVFWTKGQVDDEFIDKAKQIVNEKKIDSDHNKGYKLIFNEDGTVNERLVNSNNEINKLDRPKNTIITTPYFCDALVEVVKK